MYSDSSLCDKLGKTSKHPIYLSLGNIPYERRNKVDAKVIVGYLPIINLRDKNSSTIRLLKLKSFQNSMKIITTPLFEQFESGTYIKILDDTILCTMKISTIIADWLEASRFCLTYSSSSGEHPCHSCITPKIKFNIIDIPSSEIVIRTKDQTLQIIENGLEKKYSVYNLQNTFWNHPYV